MTIFKQKTNNSKEWQDNSDGWVTVMNKSKEDKEKYQKYLIQEKIKGEDLSYRDWVKQRNE